MKNYFIKLLRRLKNDSQATDNAALPIPDFLVSPTISERLLNSGKWQRAPDIDESHYDPDQPIDEAVAAAGYSITHFNLVDGGSLYHIPGGGSILFPGKKYR